MYFASHAVRYKKANDCCFIDSYAWSYSTVYSYSIYALAQSDRKYACTWFYKLHVWQSVYSTCHWISTKLARPILIKFIDIWIGSWIESTIGFKLYKKKLKQRGIYICMAVEERSCKVPNWNSYKGWWVQNSRMRLIALLVMVHYIKKYILLWEASRTLFFYRQFHFIIH